MRKTVSAAAKVGQFVAAANASQPTIATARRFSDFPLNIAATPLDFPDDHFFQDIDLP
jgi:hypothetical protein